MGEDCEEDHEDQEDEEGVVATFLLQEEIVEPE